MPSIIYTDTHSDFSKVIVHCCNDFFEHDVNKHLDSNAVELITKIDFMKVISKKVSDDHYYISIVNLVYIHAFDDVPPVKNLPISNFHHHHVANLIFVIRDLHSKLSSTVCYGYGVFTL